jgi:hypothetical protein
MRLPDTALTYAGSCPRRSTGYPAGLLHPRKSKKRTPVMADPDSIYHWRRLDPRITTSGQPTEPQLADIRALGVRHIVNLGLHTHEKALPDEAAILGRLGMTYIHIPVDFQNPTDRDFDKFCAVLADLKDVRPTSSINAFSWKKRVFSREARYRMPPSGPKDGSRTV